MSQPVQPTQGRRLARELALQMLFQWEYASQTNSKINPSESLRRFAEDLEIPADVMEYAEKLGHGISARRDEIDAKIQGASRSWKLSRMALVDLNVMRVAVFEMHYMSDPVPPKVAINEAVEVAKKYGSTDSGSFVNGLLDQISRGLPQ